MSVLQKLSVPNYDPALLTLNEKCLLVKETDGLVMLIQPGNTLDFDVDWSQCKQLTYIPDDLIIVGNLNLSYCTSLIVLPSNLRAHTVDCTHCSSLTHISNNIQFEFLIIKGCHKLFRKEK